MDKEPTIVPPAATDVEVNTKRIADGMDLLSQQAKERNERSEIFNWQALPVDAKEDYLRYMNGGVVLRSQIYESTTTGTEKLRRFRNTHTVNPSSNQQEECLYIEFPDKPNAATKLWNFHLQVGGHLSRHIASRKEKEVKEFPKSLLPHKITTWNAANYFILHHAAQKEGSKHGIFILSYYSYHQSIPDDPNGYGFICDNPWSNQNSILSDRYKDALPDLSTLLFRALACKGVLLKEAKPMLDNANGCGYRFMQMAIQMFHPDFVHDASKLCGDYSYQKIGQSFN